MTLNLASKPFVNLRPIRRAGIILAVLGVLLLGVNVYLYWNHLSGKGLTESGLQEIDDELDQESVRFQAAQAKLAGFEPDELNRKIEFVNLRILQRTFSWSRLFDQVAETLPRDVRLTSLTPRFGESNRGRQRGRSRDGAADQVSLEIRGEAKTSEALLEFVDRLFAHEAFADPDLHQEATRPERNLITFSISTPYNPKEAGASTPVPAKEGEE
ncbi:MAG: PilN domain-containing protein [Thermoanaerobaculia bacterium]